MIFDTTTDRVLINDIDVKNAELISIYNATSSTTAKATDKSNLANRVKVDFGSYLLEGQLYSDNMCLSQNRDERTDATGKICVRGMPFVLVDNINGDFGANGVFGLAPGSDATSYLENLFNQGQIKERVIGMNFENPDDKNSVSSITFGYIDYNEIEGGESGLNYYENTGGKNKWSL